MCTIFKNFSDPFILFQEHRPSHLIKKNFIQTRNRKNKKVQGGCDEEQNVGDVDLNNVLDKDIWQKSFHVTPIPSFVITIIWTEYLCKFH